MAVKDVFLRFFKILTFEYFSIMESWIFFRKNVMAVFICLTISLNTLLKMRIFRPKGISSRSYGHYHKGMPKFLECKHLFQKFWTNFIHFRRMVWIFRGVIHIFLYIFALDGLDPSATGAGRDWVPWTWSAKPETESFTSNASLVTFAGR